MDLLVSKENIQPLRGGRNVSQLEVALQAQVDPQYQQELLQQKAQYEQTIQSYVGDDPLESYYQYICWVEQSFPKHGHEGNLVNLLEDCLGRYENDSRYQNDLRLCKLWIRYIDLQQNHTELYQLLYSKRICINCAEFYKAWAYYYEAAQDYKKADKVYRLGKAELAQPMSDLVTAHTNFIYYAGSQSISGADTKRLVEQRQVLTQLHTFRGGQVDSVRVASTSNPGPGCLPMAHDSVPQRHISTFNVHEEFQDIVLGAGPTPASVLSAVRKSAPNENMMQATVWAEGVQKTSIGHKTSNIQIYEDAPHRRGIQLPKNHHAESKEDFSKWKVELFRQDDNFPSHLVMFYSDDFTKEYCIEEIRARRYNTQQRTKATINRNPCVPAQVANTEPPIVPNLSTTSQEQVRTQPVQVPYLTAPIAPTPVTVSESVHLRPPPLRDPYAKPTVLHSPMQAHSSYPSMPNTEYNPEVVNVSNIRQQHTSISQMPHHSPEQQVLSHVAHHTPMAQVAHHTSVPQATRYDMQHMYRSDYREMNPYEQQYRDVNPYAHHLQTPQPNMHLMHHHHHHHHHQTPQPTMHQLSYHSVQHCPDATHLPQHSMTSQLPENQTYNEPRTITDLPAAYPYDTVAQNLFATKQSSFWQDELSSPVVPVIARPVVTNFVVHESPTAHYDRQVVHMEPKGNAMKTPVKMLTDEELAETGSRGGLDIAATAQPIDGAQRLAMDDDDSITGFNDPYANDSGCLNTQQFNFDVVHVSTPLTKQQAQKEQFQQDVAKSTKKRLFSEENYGLSAIIEEGSHSPSVGHINSVGQSRSVFGISNQPTAVVSDRCYDFNYSQNIKANAELRLKLGIDCDSGPNSPKLTRPFETQEETVFEDEVSANHEPYPVLNIRPTDPFTSKVIEQFLQHVKFPGRHRRYVTTITGQPKLAVKKDVCYIGKDRYICDKLLGKGTYGNVYRATRCDTNTVVALKIQKIPNKWEFYICREIQARLADDPIKESFMNVHQAYFSSQVSVLVSDVHSGSMLDMINEIKSTKSSLNNSHKHQLAIYLTAEMMKIVQALHKIQIIHADIKPDNFLIMFKNDELQLQLIDFGCSIDMSLLPAGTSFTRKVKTDSFQCCEMKDDRPWNYHTDLFCIAATAHVLLFENYIDLKKTDGRWYITKKIPRYYRDELWSVFFNSMLNMQDGLPDIEQLIVYFRNMLDHNNLRHVITYMANTFRNR